MRTGPGSNNLSPLSGQRVPHAGQLLHIALNRSGALRLCRDRRRSRICQCSARPAVDAGGSRSSGARPNLLRDGADDRWIELFARLYRSSLPTLYDYIVRGLQLRSGLGRQAASFWTPVRLDERMAGRTGVLIASLGAASRVMEQRVITG